MGLSQRIAIVGTGIAGSTAAYCLSHSPHQITVYERALRPGGHSSTLDIDYGGRLISVDTGFIVYNEANYPNLTALFRHLSVVTETSDMSFAVSLDRGRFEWAGQETAVARGLFAQRRNLFSPGFLMFLAELVRFHKQAKGDRQTGSIPDVTLREYVEGLGYSRRLLENYLAPMGAAIWSSSAAAILEFPARSFIDFFDNHHLLQWGRPQWRTVSGGSRRYVDKMVAAYRSRLRLGTAVIAVNRTSAHVEILDSEGRHERFDQVVIAAHAPQALAMLSDPSQRERDLLGRLRTLPNAVFLHRDARLMPHRRAAWASWNVLRDARSTGAPVAVTYWMNRLQNIDEFLPAVYIAQSAIRAAARAYLCTAFLRSPAIRHRRPCRAAQSRRYPGCEPDFFLRRLDPLRLSRRRAGFWSTGGPGTGRRRTVAAAGRAMADRGRMSANKAAGAARFFSAPSAAASLYVGEVMHARLKPIAHRFTYRVFSLLVDLDRLDEAGQQSLLFSIGQFNLFSFNQADHGAGTKDGLRSCIRNLLHDAGVGPADGRILLWCYPRVLGFVFNPIAIFFCYDMAGDLRAVIYEVRNTFGDKHMYVAPVRRGELDPSGLRQTQAKLLFVSPFLDMPMTYRFRIHPPTDRLLIRILETDPVGPILAATFRGARRELQSLQLLGLFFGLPLLTLKIVGAIHFEALRLFAKGLRPRSKPPPPAPVSLDGRPVPVHGLTKVGPSTFDEAIGARSNAARGEFK